MTKGVPSRLRSLQGSYLLFSFMMMQYQCWPRTQSEPTKSLEWNGRAYDELSTFKVQECLGCSLWCVARTVSSIRQHQSIETKFSPFFLLSWLTFSHNLFLPVLSYQVSIQSIPILLCNHGPSPGSAQRFPKVDRRSKRFGVSIDLGGIHRSACFQIRPQF